MPNLTSLRNISREIGYILNENNRATDIAKMARAFGLGSETGIQQIPEEAGNIEDPTDPIQVVNQAIGQGTVQVTPLQVARFIAAIGNGGTLYRPQLVEKIEPVDGTAGEIVIKPEAQGTRPVQPFRMDVIKEAMREVVANPLGTANFRMRGLSIPVAGKTGTAESGSGKPHAWFAGYTRGTIRDHVTHQRRDFIRFFACGQDLSHQPPETPLPDAIATGTEPFRIVGAMAGG